VERTSTRAKAGVKEESFPPSAEGGSWTRMLRKEPTFCSRRRRGIRAYRSFVCKSSRKGELGVCEAVLRKACFLHEVEEEAR
jgi:hypothetical protein